MLLFFLFVVALQMQCIKWQYSMNVSIEIIHLDHQIWIKLNTNGINLLIILIWMVTFSSIKFIECIYFLWDLFIFCFGVVVVSICEILFHVAIYFHINSKKIYWKYNQFKYTYFVSVVFLFSSFFSFTITIISYSQSFDETLVDIFICYLIENHTLHILFHYYYTI